MGTNDLFDDRAEEVFIYEKDLQGCVPKEPDRVYGLKTTASFRDILSRPVEATHTQNPQQKVADLVKTSPFKPDYADMLLFPFLLLEAKSGKAGRSPENIIAQFAFALQVLLKLQDELRSHRPECDPHFNPLVWFISSKGYEWGVYGCYLTGSSPANYDIMQLWSGSLLFQDHALQLVLIVDFIVDWARDYYRPAIMRQLKFIATGKPFDQVSAADSNARASIPPLLSNNMEVDEGGPDINNKSPEDSGPTGVSLTHPDYVGLQSTDFLSGCIRSALISDWSFVSLRLTKRLTDKLLRQDGQCHIGLTEAGIARQIVKFLTRFDSVLVLSGTALNELEAAWTGQVSQPDYTENLEEANEGYYVIIESACYFDDIWFLIRELSVFAVSKRAFRRMASLCGGPPEDMLQRERECPRPVLSNCIKCLRSGSPQQVLLSAISCTLLTIYPRPEYNCGNHPHLVRALRFGYLRDSRLRPFKEKIFLESSTEVSNEAESPLKRMSTSRTSINWEHTHERLTCERCLQDNEHGTSDLGPGFFDTRIPPEISGNFILVVSSDQNPRYSYENGVSICLFALTLRSKLDGEYGIPADILLRLKDRPYLYHTIRHVLPDSSYVGSIAWNLPLPYRPITDYESIHIKELNYELDGLQILDELALEPEDTPKYPWDETQMLLYLLSIGYSYLSAKFYVDKLVSEKTAQNLPYSLEKLREKTEGPAKRQVSQLRWKLKGNEVARPYSEWAEGERYLEKYLETHHN